MHSYKFIVSQFQNYSNVSTTVTFFMSITSFTQIRDPYVEHTEHQILMCHHERTPVYSLAKREEITDMTCTKAALCVIIKPSSIV